MIRPWPGTLLVVTSAVLATSSINAQLPPALVEQEARTAQLAVEAARRGPVTPIPLNSERARTVGQVYDQFLIGVIIARAQMADGGQPDTAAIVAHPRWRDRSITIVAYPLDCDGHPNQPLAIRLISPLKLPVDQAPVVPPTRGAEAQSLLPGISVPNDALVVSLRNAPMVGASVEIDYEGGVCHGGSKTASFPLQAMPSIEMSKVFLGVKVPDGLASVSLPATVRLRVTVDPLGRARFPEQVQGPPELAPAAIDLLSKRSFQPPTINGVAMPLMMLVPIVFTATGEPAPPAPYSPAPPAGGPGTLVTTRTVTTTTAMPAPAPATTLPPVPPAPRALTEDQLARLAIEVAEKGDPVPVPLDAAGPAVHGVMFDSFLVSAIKARAAIKAGSTPDPATIAASVTRENPIVVAFPLTCGGRTIAPSEITMYVGGPMPGPVRDAGSVIAGQALADRLPGVQLPEGAVGRAFLNAAFSAGPEVRIGYPEPPCGAADRTLTLPVQWVRGQSLPHLSTTKLPAGSTLPSPTIVRVRGVVDLSGAYRFPTLADGPAELATAAALMTSQWKFNPYRANGVSSPQYVITTVTFTTSGMPEPGPAPTMPAPAPAAAAGPPIMTSSTIGGRSTTDMTTPDEPGLSAATSKCEIASAATYGLSNADAVKLGGGPMQAASRQRQYLSALRGPAGQGLRFVRRGSTLGADKQTILDLYEITYAGLTAPLLVYLDAYHEEPLKAPQGLVCAAPIVIR